MVQTGVLTALELRDRFDPARGVPFPVFIKPRVLGAMIDISRRAGSIKRREEAYVAESESVTPDDALDLIIGCESADILAEEIEKLPEDERTAISLFYLEELRNKDVAGIMGVTEVRVVRYRERALTRLAAAIHQRTFMTDQQFEETAGESL
jgi:RNA polymerase sigma factor (sigma-70 family)